MNAPLAGVSVLESSGDIAVRYCGRLFSRLGARVVRMGSDDDRTIGYGGRAGECFGQWLDEDKERVAALRDTENLFDVVIGGQDRDAVLTAEQLARRSHNAIFVALTWFDLDGPYADWRASDEIISALNGVAYTFGESAGPPMLAQGHAPQLTAGLVAFNATLAALLAPRRPQRVDVNVFEASLCFSETAALTGGSVRLGINKFVPTYPCSAYRTRDGWIGVTCLTPTQWRALCRLIARPDLEGDARFATAYERLMLSDEVDAALGAALILRTTEEWVALGDANRIPIAPMVRPGLLPQAAHWQERGAFADIEGSGIEAPTLPYRIAFDGATKPRAIGDGAGALAGIRVVDFSMGWAGPLCARTLADLGADVVKVESEGHPDWWRGWETGSVDPTTRETKLNFIAVNRNKRGVDIDLTSPVGIDQAKALVRNADVVVENFAAGVLGKLGLSQDVQRALAPNGISLSMPAFGSGGPLSGLRAYGSTVEQASGLPFVNGEAHWIPCQQHIAFGDPIAGLYGASAILAALYARPRLGGARIDMAQVECLFQICADAIIAEQQTGGPVPRTGHARRRLHLCRVVQTTGVDRWLAVVAKTQSDLYRLQEIVGVPIDARLEEWARLREAIAAAAELQAVGIAAAPVLAPFDLIANQQLDAAGFWIPMHREVVGKHLVGASPFRFDGVRPALYRPAPLLGEHTAAVLREIYDAGGRA